MFKTTISSIPLVLAHVINYQISLKLIHRLLLPYLTSTSSTTTTSSGTTVPNKRLITSLNNDLTALQFNCQLNHLPTEVFSNKADRLKPQPTAGILASTTSSEKEEELMNRLKQFLFNITISLSLQIVSLVFFEIVKFGNSSARKLDWSITLILLILLLAYIIPSILLTHIILNFPVKLNFSLRKRFIAFLSALVAWTIGFRVVNDIIFSSTRGNAGIDIGFIQETLTEITLLGITCLAVLNGMGTISSLFYTFFKKYKIVKKNDISKLVDTLKTTDNLIVLRNEELSALPSSANNSDLKNEIKALNQMRLDLVEDVSYLIKHYKMQKHSNTLSGKLGKLYKVSFAVYCIYKIISIMVFKLPFILLDDYYSRQKSAIEENELTAPSVAPDALAVSLAKLLIKFFKEDYDVDVLATNISLVLSISLFLLSFQSVLNTFHKFKRFIPSIDLTSSSSSTHTYPRHRAFSSSSGLIVELIISELTGIYLLSTTLMMNAHTLSNHLDQFDSLDPATQQHSQHDTSLMAIRSGPNNGDQTSEFMFIDVWFDKCFAVSCLISCVGMFLFEQLERFYTDDYDDDDDIYSAVYDEEEILGKESSKLY